MSTRHRDRAWWLFATPAALLAWFVGAYLPFVSNLWVQLNLLTPAGHPHLAALPLDYPAVGIDSHTTCSLLGVVIVVTAITRWITYFERCTPPPDISQPPPGAAPATTALSEPNRLQHNKIN